MVRLPGFLHVCVTLKALLRPYTTLQHPCSPQTNNYVTTLADQRQRQGAINKIKWSDCQASYIGDTGRNLNTRPTEHKGATRNGDANNHIALHHKLTNHNINWDTAKCLTYNTNYFQTNSTSRLPTDRPNLITIHGP